MDVVVTGGAGFLGARLAGRLLARGALHAAGGREEEITRLTLVDVAPARGFADRRLHVIAGSIADPVVVEAAVTPETDAIFHLAAVVSGQAEAEFDLGMQVNFAATRLLLERARRNENRPRLVFTSSVAVFGGELPEVVEDASAPTPQSSYGVEKLLCELLVQEYSRRGFLDGRCLRMPTICVRPGAPNKAASSFASSIIREPLAGLDAVCPVPPETRLWLLSPRRAIDALLRGHELDAASLGSWRSLNVPGLSVTVGEMVAALERLAGPAATARIRWEPDPAIASIVASWPGAFATRRADALGFRGDASFDEIVRDHAAEALSPRAGVAAQHGASP